ncbi:MULTISPECIES: LysR family transcriptional regulator [Chromobacterium]|uniref:LysR family transcriptional regulator n=1 Tax=Chromobacterium TaxID=535 RepID=UPI0005BC8404|nr:MULTISPECIES: LysR family transcriptional regulator [Chromobacterium]MDH0342291.1 LysR family transcriptional regulator [Chromobacterium haemolyticum]QOZ83013.1 LysR family transcriptional regulator [Chromobacterium sp. Rain0013]WON83094.1 LysR family transcriptional regulator [Chromobacterium haemolyticum]
MDRFSEIRAFVCVAELGSFAAAAERLELSRAMVTKLVSSLEGRLGVRLMHRTTRRLSLTEAGETYLGQAGGLLAELDDLDARLSQGASSPVGRLRVSAPVSFGMRYLGRVVAGFHQQYPQIEVELNLNDRRVDLVEEGFDLGLRVSNLSDSSLVARRLARIRDLVVAAPSYLQRCGTPATPADLAEHQCLLYALTTQPNLWDFTAPDGSSGRVKVKGMLRANNGDILTDAAIHGMGVILQPRFLVEQGLAEGTLVPLLSDYDWHCLDLSAVYPARRHVPGKVRAFVDYLQQFFQ